jgi:large subunit ribosomal protein L6
MSRVGKSPISLPSGVTISITNGDVVVSGPKGTLNFTLPEGIDLKVDQDQVVVSRLSDVKRHRALHGLVRALVNNMVHGVSSGYERKLEINGVGFRVAQAGSELKFNLGFSHDVIYKLPSGVTSAIDQNIITIGGIDKQQVGQVAAEIRALKKPEPYKGKGIKYLEERIIRKAGKSGKDK